MSESLPKIWEVSGKKSGQENRLLLTSLDSFGPPYITCLKHFTANGITMNIFLQ